MTKGMFSVVAGLFSLCLPLFGQEIQRPDVFKSLNNSPVRTPSLALSDAHLFTFPTGFAWMEPTRSDFLPALPTVAGQSQSTRNVSYSMALSDASKDSPKETKDLAQRNLLDSVHGEVGFFYGRSSGGRFSGDTEGGYVIGEVGDDKVHISVGASYENSNFSFSRRGR